MTIMENLASIIKEKGLRKIDVSNAIGVPQSSFIGWFSRMEDFPARYIIPLCQDLEVSPERLLTGHECVTDGRIKLTDDERYLIDTVRKGGRDALIVTTCKAVEEARRIESSNER